MKRSLTFALIILEHKESLLQRVNEININADERATLAFKINAVCNFIEKSDLIPLPFLLPAFMLEFKKHLEEVQIVFVNPHLILQTNQLVSFRTHLDSILSLIIPYIPFTSELQNDIEDIQKRRKILEESMIKYETLAMHSENLFGLLEDHVKKNTIGRFGTRFGEEADKQRTLSLIWIIFSIVIFVTIVSLIVNGINRGLPNWAIESSTTAIFYMVLRIGLITTLFYGLSVCIRQYKVLLHNMTINRHKQLALSTFDGFVSSAGEEKGTKDIVLLEVTKTIFDNPNPGYIKQDGSDDDSDRWVQILKLLADRK